MDFPFACENSLKVDPKCHYTTLEGVLAFVCRRFGICFCKVAQEFEFDWITLGGAVAMKTTVRGYEHFKLFSSFLWDVPAAISMVAAIFGYFHAYRVNFSEKDRVTLGPKTFEISKFETEIIYNLVRDCTSPWHLLGENNLVAISTWVSSHYPKVKNYFRLKFFPDYPGYLMYKTVDPRTSLGKIFVAGVRSAVSEKVISKFILNDGFEDALKRFHDDMAYGYYY